MYLLALYISVIERRNSKVFVMTYLSRVREKAYLYRVIQENLIELQSSLLYIPLGVSLYTSNLL